MSYDYNALVTNLSSHRESATAAFEAKDTAKYVEHLQESLQVFETLSGHCPMTPLLWLQYAYDMYSMMTSLEEGSSETAQQARLQTLELALNEFPGSAVLQLHYCELLVESLNPEGEEAEEQLKTTQQALLKALQQVGSGSHRNEGEIIAQLYRVHAHFAFTHKKNQDAALASLLQRAGTPMESSNESLMQEINEFSEKAKIPSKTMLEEFLPALEEARRWEAKAYSRLRSCEDDVSMAMHQEQIKCDNQALFSPNDTEKSTISFVTTSPEFEETVMRAKPEKSQRYWMGLGGAATAKAFLHYVAASQKLRFPKDEDSEDQETERGKQQQQLVLSVLERAIAECPTVESVWLTYLKHLTWLWNNQPANAPSPQTFKTVSARSVRNCPFSLALTQQQLHISLLLANKDQSEHVMDPDDLLQIINKALDSKFLPSPAHAFDLFVTAIRVVQRRVLFLLSKTVVGFDPTKKAKQASVLKFDDIELLPSKVPKKIKAADPPGPLDDDSWQEVQDLLEEMKDMFQAALGRLNKDHQSWTEGRAMLLREQGLMERVVIGPLLSMASSDEGSVNGTIEGSDNSSNDAFVHLEKALKVQSPPHPDSYKALIEHVLNHGASPFGNKRTPGDVVSRLRQVRGLYQKAVQSVGKSKVKDAAAAMQTATSTSTLRDYETALSCLCHHYQEFERVFGSEQSLANATRSMQKKLQKTTFQAKRHGEKPMDVDEKDASESPKGKRKASNADDEPKESDDEHPPNKRRKKDDSPEAPPRHSNVQPKQHHKVKIGTIFHRAHPFTVRISNLAPETEEMDIIEAFKQEHKCGAVVYCRVQREKPMHGKGNKGRIGASKGWGLLQFEERESVEKAVDLDQKVELHGKALHVERSHVPAVGIVPPGMHRPKHAKHSEPQQDAGKAENKDVDQSGKPAASTAKQAPSKPTTGSSMGGVLAFRPRGVAQKGPKRGRPKTKLDLSPPTQGGNAKK